MFQEIKMEEIERCCKDRSRKKLSILKIRNEIKELNELRQNPNIQWTESEQNCLQNFIQEKTETINYLKKNIKDTYTCCSILEKARL